MTEQREVEGAAGDAMLRATRAFARQIAATAAARDLDRTIPHDEARTLRKIGIQAARVPAAYGGPGLRFVDLVRVMAELAAGDPNLAQMLQPHMTLLDWLQIDGSEALRRRCFADVVNGAIITNAIAERGTKTPGHFETTLRREGGGYRMNGTKFYSTGSLIADQLFVLATLEDGVHAVAIIPIRRDGVTVIDDWDGMGQRTTASGTTRLVDVAVEDEEVMRLPGFGQQRSYLGAAAQVSHAAIDVGIARAALRDAVTYAREKARPVFESGVDRASEDPYVMHLVGEMAVIVDGADALLERSAAHLDAAARAHAAQAPAGERERLFIESSIAVAQAKAAATQACLRVSEMLFGVGGASATLRKYDLDRHWRNARTHTTHDPVAYKYKAIGDYLLNDRPPPISTKI